MKSLMKSALLALVPYVASPVSVLGQTADPPGERVAYPVIELDVSSRLAKDTLPFHKPFVIKVPLEAGQSLSTVSCRQSTDGGPQAVSCETLGSSPLDDESALVKVEPLHPNRTFELDLSITTPAGFGRAEATRTVSFAGRTPTTPFTSHFDGDVGLIRTHRAEYVGLVTAVHFYVDPINEEAGVAHGQLERQLSLMLGLSIVELDTDAPVTKQFAAGNPVVGIGWRRIPVIRRLPPLRDLRVTVGLMFFKQKDANPLVDTTHQKRDWFVGASIDLEYQSVLSPVLSAFGIG